MGTKLMFLVIMNLIKVYAFSNTASELPIQLYSSYLPFSSRKLNCGSTRYFYNPSTYVCQECPLNQVLDKSQTDAVGNYIKCKCAPGFYQNIQTAIDCTSVRSTSLFDIDIIYIPL